jgi:glutathione synthase/RimK-type ligase-like ATP-grasp enzyme
MNGEFIADRKIEKILDDLCAQHSITHKSFSAGWVHAFKKAGKTSRLLGYKWSLNDSAASGIAGDKVATYEILKASNVPVVEHILLRTKVDFAPHWPVEIPDSFVLKPLTGTSGRGIVLCRSKVEAEQYILQQKISEWAISPYYKIDHEVRMIMLDDKCLLAYDKQRPSVRNDLKFFNLGAGAKPVDIEPTNEQSELARRSMEAIGLQLAAVDLVLVGDKWRVLEVNDGFMMEHYLRESETNFQKTVNLYEKVLIASIS